MADIGRAQDESIKIANEFTVVTVRKVYTRNGERLEIECKKTGRIIQLDAMQLEALTLAKPDDFTRLFEKHLEGDQEKNGTAQGTTI